jgi:hypothetical protein
MGYSKMQLLHEKKLCKKQARIWSWCDENFVEMSQKVHKSIKSQLLYQFGRLGFHVAFSEFFDV